MDALLAMLQDANGDKAVVILLYTNELPTFTKCNNAVALPDEYITGLEPGTDYPNPKSFICFCVL